MEQSSTDIERRGACGWEYRERQIKLRGIERYNKNQI